MMGRVFSFRGKLSCRDNAVVANHQVFDYVSPDRTKAWRVKEAYFWPVDWWGVAIGGPGFVAGVCALATDVGKFNQNELLDPSENRMIAWGSQTYNHRDDNVHFITPNATPLGAMKMLVDPDHLITKQLFINIGSACDVDISNEREWGWCIIVEEVKVTPSESVFQQIKGIGQDIDA